MEVMTRRSPWTFWAVWFKDIYLPQDYYNGEPRGFGFVQHLDPAGTADAKYHVDGYVLLCRELTVVFAEENRKKPSEMRARQHRRSWAYRRSPLHYLDHHNMLEVTAAVHSIILLLGKDITKGQFHPVIEDTEGVRTQGHPMAQGDQARALVGGGAEVWTNLGD
ncbi:uncharacterized protein LOC111294562 [Durio zibethinus]|uniref:Uncharacterized protein LOC111294562 n=1 Tax=Durio zibethinus TaxID=66656 RepID=A0A6P5YTR2_DURZI|nr:uncharacterized protein LOC111294562 [Durio zibethinus]XP_022743674.1 uncharacterized protein LOC111294562 [Durio zibethinus]XP_022743675.1 uncharacterized protein LOC111294562 [Durio zibethinus]XP_022743676.1 uncharacterized protein LOC111294562 [Durio zibethinus]XP_022743677.1 uncharacterized protein LOC111294562 [Durio zibethinus]XP_022743678.1 uncharacterized protein LOC111294562 [Durio zibethinus]XP_022743679.1 uncharacterized protein LOC111294562 [Durio zibethinus]XP_022743681.1 unc